ncbi:MAG TPA: Uma2 family endonuclease [Isosphaeraceae bacterium]|nr:Uma2 family endonuclease [Isosphaeraceae bacterium]
MSSLIPSARDLREHLSDPDAHYEIVDGRIQEIPSKGMFSTLVGLRLCEQIASHVEPRRLGVVIFKALFILDASRPLLLRPDVAFVSAERWPLDRLIPEIGDWEVIPDLAIEVMSPNDVELDVQQKLKEYLAAGVKQVWHVRPLVRNVMVYRSLRDVKIFTAADQIEAENLLPGLRIDLGPIFRTTVG